MINGLFLGPIHLIQETILFNKRDEMSLHMLLHLSLSFIHGLHMIRLDLLVFLEHFTDLLWRFALGLFVELL